MNNSKQAFFIFGSLVFFAFTIFPTTVYGAAIVTFPNGGECLNGAGTYNITWTLTSNHTAIAYRTDGITPPTWQAENSAYFKHPTQNGATSYTWNVSDEETGTVSTARIWLDAHANGHGSEGLDSSNSDFSIDNSPPSAPTLSSSSKTNTSVDLSWTASTDGGCEGLTGYKVFRDGAQIASGITGTAYTDSGLSASVSYSYQVKAYDDFATTTSNTLGVTTSAKIGSSGSGDIIFPAVIVDLSAETISTTSIKLTWTAPGDDVDAGTVASYDARYFEKEITIDTWDLSTQITVEPAPKQAGLTQSMTISGLTPATTYYFALNSIDDGGNEAKFSNVVSAKTLSPPNTIPPATITDLTFANILTVFADLLWTAPGDDGDVGKAARYDIRYAKTSLSEESWSLATVFINTITPKESGINEAITITDLESGSTYYFAIKTSDYALNESSISNVITITTLVAPKDKEVTGEVIASEAAGTGFSEGDLIRAAGGERVYVIKNNKKVWITTAEAFIKAGYEWSDIQEVSASDVVSTVSGNLLRVEGDPKVYIVERGLKRHIPNPESFNSYSYKWEDIVEVSAVHLAGYKDAALMRALDDFKVYLLEGNTKQWIKTAQDFNSAGYDWNEVLDVNRTELESYITKDEEAIAKKEPIMVDVFILKDKGPFSPATITIAKGDTVRWVNNDSILRDVSSNVHPLHTLYPPLNLGAVEAGETISFVFDTAGTYKYHDHLYAEHGGTVIVSEEK